MEPTTTEPLLRFAAALLIGALVGLEREFAHHDQRGVVTFAGIRTFPIISAFGFMGALASDYANWAFPTAFLALALLNVMVYYIRTERGSDTGTTTQITALLVFLLGALCFWGELALAVAAGVVLTLLLSYKPTLHRMVGLLSTDDVHALLKFALISAVILPALPNRDLGPGGVFNPRLVWLMVVFVSGISFSGYGFRKLLGDRTGLGTTGILGGLASSTAVTYSLSRQEKTDHARTRGYAGAIALATAMLPPRIAVILAVWAPTLLGGLAVPLAALFALALAGSLLVWRGREENLEPKVGLRNPFELGPAFTFGIVFAIILIVVRGSFALFGSGGVYATSFVAGAEGLDAITLSLTRLVPGTVAAPVAMGGILLAYVSNTLVKAGICVATGSGNLRRLLLPFFGVQVAVALLLLLLA